MSSEHRERVNEATQRVRAAVGCGVSLAEQIEECLGAFPFVGGDTEFDEAAGAIAAMTGAAEPLRAQFRTILAEVFDKDIDLADLVEDMPSSQPQTFRERIAGVPDGVTKGILSNLSPVGFARLASMLETITFTNGAVLVFRVDDGEIDVHRDGFTTTVDMAVEDPYTEIAIMIGAIDEPAEAVAGAG